MQNHTQIEEKLHAVLHETGTEFPVMLGMIFFALVAKPTWEELAAEVADFSEEVKSDADFDGDVQLLFVRVEEGYTVVATSDASLATAVKDALDDVVLESSARAFDPATPEPEVVIA